MQNYHRIPLNTTYWKNWPTEDNPYINDASWHLTYQSGAVEPAAGLTRRCTPLYIARRFGVFLLIVWLAATLNFFLPKLSGQDPVRTKLLEEASLGGYVQAGIEDMVKEYQQKFGLDKPLWRQYLTLSSTMSSHGDLNYSIANYPRTVVGMIARGAALDDRLARPHHAVLVRRRHHSGRAARLARSAALDALAHAAVMGAARHPVLSARAGADVSVRVPVPVAADLRRLQRRREPGMDLDIRARRAAPRACCRRCRSCWSRSGGWALAMRGMMVTTMGEDYVTFAEAKGLRSATIFTRYCMRNAILPQTTGLALALGQILSGAVLVEVIFGYPGIGALLFQAIEENDFFLIQGIVFTVIVALGLRHLPARHLLSLARPAHFLSARAEPRCSRYLRRNASLAGRARAAGHPGGVHGGRRVHRRYRATPSRLSVPALQPPSWDYPFGTDRQGRDLLAVMVAGTPLTLRIGFIAGIHRRRRRRRAGLHRRLLRRHGRYA